MKNISIPHNHVDIIKNCDFIYQTALALQAKNNSVSVILRKHPTNIVVYLINICLLTLMPHSRKTHVSLPKQQTLIYTEKNILLLQPFELCNSSCIKNFGFTKKINEKINLYSTLLLLKIVKTSIVWSFDHQNFDIFQKVQSSLFTVYDCVDYFSSIDQEINSIIQKQEKSLIQNADLVITNSSSLYTIHAKTAKNIVKTVQGFDLKEFTDNNDKKLSIYERKIIKEISNYRQKKIVYIGVLNHRLDFKLLHEVIQNNQECIFILPETISTWEGNNVQKDIEAQYRILKKEKNTFFYPSLSRQAIKKIISSSDIGIIPYDCKQSFNTYCYPMKVFEYFYMKIPVLSTPIIELKQPIFQDLVMTSNDAQTWTTSIKKILKNPWPDDKKKKQRSMAIENSWDNKITIALNEIDKLS